MSDTVIRVENLGKKYVLKHEERLDKHKTLRDVISNQTKSLLQAVNPLSRSTKLKCKSAYEEFWALKDVSFEIKQGDRVGIIGRNGAGKSTLLKILSRIVEPTKGRIAIKGRITSLLEVGTGFHPELTGRENVFLNGAILGMSQIEIKRKFDEIVNFAEVEKFLDTPVKRYSSGMYVRLAFAVAAHLEPEILIVDEVLAVGDVQFQKKCIGKMGEVSQEGRTLLFVSHNLGVVQTLCSRGIFLGNGNVLADDTTSAAVSVYLKTLEEASFQNLLERKERRGKGKARLIKIEISTGGSNPSTTLATGCPALFSFYITNVLPNLTCSFTVYDQYGQPVTYFDSAVPGHEDVIDPDGGAKFCCEIDELLLIPGRYRINAALTCGRDLQDHVEAAAFVEVEEGEIGGRPVFRENGYGNVLVRHRWLAPA